MAIDPNNPNFPMGPPGPDQADFAQEVGLSTLPTANAPRKAKLKRTVADRGPEEQQVLTFITPNLSDERWEEISNYLCYLLRQEIALRSELDSNLKNWNDLYEGAVPEGKTIPWEGCANINVPLVQEMLDGLHSRLAKSSLGVSPLVLVKGQDDLGVEVEYKLERYYGTLADSIDLAEAISTGVFLGLRDGVGILKVMWDRRTRKIKTRKMKPLLDENQQPIFDPIKQQPIREEVIEIDDVVEFDNARVVSVELKDFYVLPAHAYDITRHYAKGVAERHWGRYDDLFQRAKSKMYRMDKVEALKAATAANRSAIEPEHQTYMGVTVFTQIEGFYEYELFDVYMNYDLDGDGYEEECVFTVSPYFNIMLRAEVFPYWHQLRPYIPIIPWPRPRRFYGFAVPQRLEATQRELNAIHNQRLDAVTLRLSPPLLINRSATLRGDAAQAWGPGAHIEVNDIKDVDVMTLPDINPSSFSEETILRQYAERIIGLYDINTPRGTGARRTRAEIGAIQQEGMVRFDYMMKLVQRSIVKTFEQLHQLKIQYMPDEETFEALGLDGVQKFTIQRAEMLANIKFVANGDLPVQDKEQNRQDAYFLYTALMQNPLVMSDPSHVYHTTKKLLQAWEEKSPEKYIGTIEQVMEQSQAAQAAATAAGGAQPGGPAQRPAGPAGAGGQRGVPASSRRPQQGP